MKEKIIDLVIYMLLWLYSYFSPAYHFVAMIGFLVLCDTITGILSSIKTEDGYDWCNFRSRKLRNTLSKFTAYAVAIFVATVIQKEIIQDVPLIRIIGGFICFIEIKSLNENIEVVTGVNFLKSITDGIREKFNPERK